MLKKIILMLNLSFLIFCTLQAQPPKAIVGIVIDQGAAHYILRLNKYFQHGIRRFIDQGTFFTNAHYPYAAPVTAAGHATIGTGCLPKEHGIIMNSWYTPDGNLIASVDGEGKGARVHAAKSDCGCYVSSQSMLTPSFADLATASSAASCTAYSVSYKDRAAIGMAGHKGNAIWFDEHQQAFTSNHEYFSALPKWLTDFNHTLPNRIEHARRWNLFFEPTHKVYATDTKEIYHLSSVPKPIAGTLLEGHGEWKKLSSQKNFMLSPHSNKILLDLAYAGLQDIAKKNPHINRSLMMISLSSLDKVGHIYGPHSTETVDTLLHMDKLIGDFMNKVDALHGQGNTLFFLTADHGVSPIPENLQEERYKPARRIIMYEVVEKLNTEIERAFNVKDLFFGFKTNQLFWDEKKLATISKSEQMNLIRFIKKYLQDIRGIRKVWTLTELQKSKHTYGFKRLFQNQCYQGRSGAFFLFANPYVMLANFDKGSCHRTPYNHDTHVPLIFLQQGKIPHKKIRNRVSITQIAPTLAKIWKISPHEKMEKKILQHVVS